MMSPSGPDAKEEVFRMKYGWLFAALLLNCVLNGLGMELLPSEEWRNANRKETEVRSSAASEVEIRIVGTMRNHGAYLLQKKLPKNSAYCFSADVSAARPGIAYLSVKLFKGGKESARLTSPLNQVPDGRMQIEFETGDADAVQFLLRTVLLQENIGEKVRFRNIRLEEKKRLELVPGYENCSVYLNRCGADSSGNFEGKVFYREAGSSLWLSALDLVYVPQEKAARSSVVRLRENCAYELKLELNDNGRKETLQSAFTTKNSKVPIARTIVLNHENFKGHLVIRSGGRPDGYVRYTAEKGFVLKGAPGENEVVRLDNVRYVVLEGLTIQGESTRNGIFVSGGSDLQILNCDISGYSLVGTHRPELDGKYYDEQRKALNYHSGIYLKNTKDVLVERCYIHDPAASTNPWFYSHPAGPNAVMVDKVAGLVLRYNDFVGNNLTRWNDAVEGGANGFPDGGPRRDAEIRGNYFALSNDDGIELDGGQMNTRLYDNKFEATFCGVSTAPCLLGPSYLFNNLFVNPGDQFGQINAAFKNNHSSRGYGRVYGIGNTAAGDFCGITPFNGSDRQSLKAVFCNNLFAVGREIVSKDAFRDRLFFERNLFWSSLPGASERMEQLLAKTGKEAAVGNLFREPLFLNRENGNFLLRESSPGRGGAALLPNFQTVEKADIGISRAFPLPYRPLGFYTDRSELHFERNNLSGKFVLSADSTFRGRFRIRKNFSSDFLSVTPAEGTLAPGEKIVLTVSIHPEKLRIAGNHKAVFLVRSESGLSRPVFVTFDNSRDAVLAKSVRKNLIYADRISEQKNGECTIEFQLPADGRYYLFLFVKEPPYAVNVSLDGVNFRKGVLYGRRRSGWHWLALLPENTHGANRPFEWKKGEKVRLHLKQRWNYRYQVRNAVLAVSPEQMLYAPEVE